MPNQNPAEALDDTMEELKGILYPDDMGTIEHYQWQEAKAAITAYAATVEREAELKARIDELKKITKNTFDKPATPENQNDQTWQGGYRFAKNSLKRYKLARLAALQGPLDAAQ